MSRSWIAAGTIIVTGLMAFVVASPLGVVFGTRWMPAINFGIGTAVILIAVVEGVRALRAWSDRAATLGWIAGGLVASIGLIIAGSSLVSHAYERSYNPTTGVSIIIALLGILYQARAGDRRASPA